MHQPTRHMQGLYGGKSHQNFSKIPLKIQNNYYRVALPLHFILVSSWVCNSSFWQNTGEIRVLWRWEEGEIFLGNGVDIYQPQAAAGVLRQF